MPGDSVDVYISVAGAREALRAERQGAHDPDDSWPERRRNLVLRIETADAATWAYAADNTQFYFVLRPVVGAKPTKPSQATAATVLR